MPIFQPLDIPHHWQPQPLAAGPFAGLQGGAVASLLTAEIEAIAADRQWGRAVSVATHFLRAVGETEPCATARVTFVREHGVDVPGFAEPLHDLVDPARYPARTVRAAHGGPWFMDAMEARAGDGVA